jgi:hypothetical protein
MKYFDKSILILSLESRVSNKSRNRSRNVVSSNEGHDGNHSKTSIVEFTASLSLKSCLVNLGEVKLGENNLRKRTALGVVNILRLGGNFSNKDSSNNLCLSNLYTKGYKEKLL